MKPVRPTHLSEHAEQTLQALAAAGLGHAISLGGALGLLRQQRAGSDTDAHRARLALATHLSRIIQHRPIAGITDLDQRVEAESLRAWFGTEFPNALLD